MGVVLCTKKQMLLCNQLYMVFIVYGFCKIFRTIEHDLFHSPPGVELFIPEKYYSMTWCV